MLRRVKTPRLLPALAALLLSTGGCSGDLPDPSIREQPSLPDDTVLLETTEGTILVELLPEKAPLSVANFLRYARAGKYDGTLFHRVVRHQLIQCGKVDRNGDPLATFAPVPSEARNGLRNRRGTLALVRGSAIESATSEFLINSIDNPFLDHRGEMPQQYGYAVFGRVKEGMDVVERIQTATVEAGPLSEAQPVTRVILERVVLPPSAREETSRDEG
jgi:cyclophilin family peptidyl-prolyl cis-trans isomerase